MANLVNIKNFLPEPNKNLLPEFAMFDDTSFIWNIPSGRAIAETIDQQQLNGSGCLKVTPTSKALVNSGGSQMQITIQEDGNYVFSLRHKCYCATANTQQINVKVYINALATDYTFTVTTDDNNVYKTYCQVIPLLQNDVIDFAFEFEAATEVGVFRHYFDALKFEFANFGISIPTIFSRPENITLTTSATIDVPSISSNSYSEVTATLTGAEIGDFLQMTYPSEIITLGLIVGYPIVTATDTVKFLIHNHSGGSVNPASGTYTFKIIK